MHLQKVSVPEVGVNSDETRPWGNPLLCLVFKKLLLFNIYIFCVPHLATSIFQTTPI